MKKVFSILLFCLIFESVLTIKKSFKMKLTKAIKEMKIISEAKEKKLRKLDGTDETDSGSGETDTAEATTPPAEDYESTASTAAESGSATAKNAEVEVSKPVATKTKTTNNKKAEIQAQKFHTFKRQTNRITFGLYFYFLGRPIVKYIIMRLRLIYSSRLRNLAETAESARTDCVIGDTSLLGSSTTGGANINYECSANTTKNANSITNVTLNTDIPLTLVNSDGKTETLDFGDVNFNANSTEEASNIQDNEAAITSSSTLKNAVAYTEKYILRLVGTFSRTRRLLRNLALTNGQTITMNLDNDGTSEAYDCTINGVTDGSSSELVCDTSDNPIKTTVGDLHLSSGSDTDGNQLLIEMNNPDSNSTETLETTSSSNKYTYSKSSSGLSGGAIAGIVIACVVALAAASIAAIMLRKPAPPIENTTVVDLKNDNI